MKVLVIIPAYNEEKSIERVVSNLRELPDRQRLLDRFDRRYLRKKRLFLHLAPCQSGDRRGCAVRLSLCGGARI